MASSEDIEHENNSTQGNNGGEHQEPPSLQIKFIEAVKNDDYQTFTKLMTNPNVDPNHQYGKEYKYTTCLGYVCRNPGRGRFLKELLSSRKVKPNINEIHPEPIHWACKSANVEALHILLKDKRTKINATDKNGRTALHYTAKESKDAKDDEMKNRYIQCVKMLMERCDCLINLQNSKGYTAIYEAAHYGCKEIVEAMLKFGGRSLELDIPHESSAKTARQLIKEKYPDIELPLSLPKTVDMKFGLHKQLIKALQKQDLERFSNILNSFNDNGYSQIDPNYWCPTPHSATFLEIAIKDTNNERFVEALLKAGADPNIVNPVTRKTCLHLAVENGNVKVVDMLLNTARNISVNIQCKNENTALGIAVKNNNKEIVESILNYAKKEEISINENDLQLVRSTYPDLVAKLKLDAAGSKERNIQSKLFQHLYENETNKFLHTYENELSKDDQSVTYNNGILTLLQLAVKENFPDVVKFLLEKGIDPNDITKKGNESPPLIIATHCQNYEILKIFLKSSNSKFNINVKDAKRNTALHFAARNYDLHAVSELLRAGADVNIKNVYDKLPLTGKVIEGLLNKCVISDGHPSNEEFKIIFKFDFLLSLKKETVIIPQLTQPTERHANAGSEIENFEDAPLMFEENEQNSNGTSDVSRTEQNVKSSSSQTSLVEPGGSTGRTEGEEGVAASGLHHSPGVVIDMDGENDSEQNSKVKSNISRTEQNVKSSSSQTSLVEPGGSTERTEEEKENAASVVYHSRSVSVNTDKENGTARNEVEIRLSNSNRSQPMGNAINCKNPASLHNAQHQTQIIPETELLFRLLKYKEHKNVVNHPVIRCFLQFKWNHVKHFYYTNLFVMTIFMLHLNAYFLLNPNKNILTDVKVNFSVSIANLYTDIPVLQTYLFCVAVIIVCNLFARELFQLIMGWKIYYKNLENYIDWGIIIVTLFHLFCIPDSYIAVIGVLLSWLELTIICGRLREFSLKVEMLKKVSVNYFKCLLPYIFIIFAFAFSFYILFHKENTGEYNFFTYPWATITKAIVMMSGEFNSDDFTDSNDKLFFGPLCMIVFLMSLFFSSMVLFNLLTGLAVSDTKAIADNAKQLSLESQLHLIYGVEKIIMDCYEFVDKCCTGRIFQNLVTFHEKLLEDVMVFSVTCFKDHKIIIYPNNKAKTEIEDDKDDKDDRCYELKIDPDILDDAKNIILERVSERNNGKVETEFKNTDTPQSDTDSETENKDQNILYEQVTLLNDKLDQHELQLRRNQEDINKMQKTLGEHKILLEKILAKLEEKRS